jgi:hypothetical protein
MNKKSMNQKVTPPGPRAVGLVETKLAIIKTRVMAKTNTVIVTKI